MKFLLSKVKTAWNTFWNALFKRYIKSGQTSFERDKDRELSREIARYYLIERDKQERVCQIISSLILFAIGALLLTGGFYKIGIEKDFIWEFFTVAGAFLIMISMAIYLKLILAKRHLDESLVTTYKKLIAPPTLPVVITTPVSLMMSMAYGGGNVVSDGGAEVTVRGICWNVSPCPSITDCTGFTQDDKGTGKFTHPIEKWYHNKKYYVRAYAANSVGIAYGNQQEFPDKD